MALPGTKAAAEPMPVFAPLAPQADASRVGTNLPFDAPFQIKFTKPMNEVSVERALTVTPAVSVSYQWDATAQILSLVPNPHWDPDTTYTVTTSDAATDQEGLSLASPIDATFQSGAPTTGTISATETAGGLIAPASAFQIVFTRPVKLATVVLRFGITPQVPFTVVGDDPTDAASQTFTVTPKSELTSDTIYVLNMADGGTDSSGANLAPMKPFVAHTMTRPAVVRFRPQDGTASYDTNQLVSVRFTVAMDEKATAAAFSVWVGGKQIAGSTYWAENDTVLVLTPRKSFTVGQTVIARVSTAARSATGVHMASAASATFKIAAAAIHRHRRRRRGLGQRPVLRLRGLLLQPDELHPHRRLGDLERDVQHRNSPHPAGPGSADAERSHL